jgi:hypothetical protein
MTGMKFKRNVAQLKNENAELAEANEPIAKLEAMKKPVPKPPGGGGGSGPPVNNDDDEPADSAAE